MKKKVLRKKHLNLEKKQNSKKTQKNRMDEMFNIKKKDDDEI